MNHRQDPLTPARESGERMALSAFRLHMDGTVASTSQRTSGGVSDQRCNWP
jgi:hypothetical protein